MNHMTWTFILLAAQIYPRAPLNASVLYYLCSCVISWLISSSSLIPVNSPEPTELELSCMRGGVQHRKSVLMHLNHTQAQHHTNRRVENSKEPPHGSRDELVFQLWCSEHGEVKTRHHFTALDLSQMLSNSTSRLTDHRKHLFSLFLSVTYP